MRTWRPGAVVAMALLSILLVAIVIYNVVNQGSSITTSNIDPPVTPAPTASATTTTTPTTSARSAGSATSSKRSVPSAKKATSWHGWVSGASGKGVENGEFGRWRGSPVGIIGTWSDTTAEEQQHLYSAEKYAAWKGHFEIAVGGFDRLSGTESYAAAARGEYVSRWRTSARNLKRFLTGSKGITYIRPFHEFNGSWYKWSITQGTVADYKKAMRLLAQTYRQEMPGVRIVWGVNSQNMSSAPRVEQSYPGNDVVDVIGVDSYNANGNVPVTSPAKWQEYINKVDERGDPHGVEKWRLFAQAKGKPMALSEWGLNRAYGGDDHPEYIRGMHQWLVDHAAKAGDSNVAGKVLYDIYFNVAHENDESFKIKDGPNPRSAAVYRGLRWGLGS